MSGITRAFLGVAGLVLVSTASLGVDTKVRNFDLEHVPNEFIVRYKDGMLSNKASQVIMEANGMSVKRIFRHGSALVEAAADKINAQDTLTMAKAIAEDPAVEFVEANTIIRLNDFDKEPNDPSYSEQYALQVIKAPRAWTKSTGSRSIVVAVIDTGIDYDHPDLSASIWKNRGEMGVDANGEDKSSNGIDDDGNGYVDDYRGWDFANDDNDPFDDNRHGTHCAGVIGALGDNDEGVAGVNWNVGLVGLKFLTGSGSGTLAGAIEAVEYATMIGVDVTSNSWGGGGFSEALKTAIERANDAGILFVAAAGNSGRDNDRAPTYPASYEVDNVIAVAATDSADALAGFSNRGLTSVDLAAPGVDIYSTLPGGQYGDLSGTSMAAPHVSGAVALVLAHFPELSAAEVKERILSSVDAVEDLPVASGGRLNLEKALED